MSEKSAKKRTFSEPAQKKAVILLEPGLIRQSMTSQTKLHYTDQFSQDSISNKIPHSWPLVPVVGKQPYQKGWTEKSYSHSDILAELKGGKATGFGLKLGKGLLAIDIDGDSAWERLEKLAGSNDLTAFSQTTAWTSGRAGRKQCLFWVAEADWHRIDNLRINTGVSGDNGKDECLEFRWLGNQSVLPPSLHPDTNKPYEWINNPLEHPPVPAPEWLIELRENYHSEYVNPDEPDLVRFPSRLYPYFGPSLAVWLLARRYDRSRWTSPGGKPTGSGIGEFTLTGASKILKRSKGHIRKLLNHAKKSGLIRDYKQSGDKITVFYTSLEKAIAIAGVDKLGPLAAIEVDDLKNLRIIATEAEAQDLQRATLYRQRQEELQQIKKKAEGSDFQQPTQLIAPTALLHPCEKPARVLARSDRFIYVESDFRFYGGSQEAIALARGISTSTVSRHLSNGYRLAASPVRGVREELPPLIKKQVMERRPLPKNMPAKICLEEGLVSMFGEWWKPHCNVYAINYRLVSGRRRRGRIQATIDKLTL